MATIEEAGKHGLGSALQAVLDDPVGALITSAELAGEFAPVLAASAAATAVTRNPAVGATVMGGGSGLIERYSSPSEFLARNGFDLSNKEDVIRFLSDPEMIAAAEQHGFKRGAIIGAFDAVSGGIAGRQILKGPLRNLLAQFFVQAGLGGGGEAAAQLATDGSVDWGDVVLEALAEFAGAPVEVVGVGGAYLNDGQSPSGSVEVRGPDRIGAPAESAASESEKAGQTVTGLDGSAEGLDQSRGIPSRSKNSLFAGGAAITDAASVAPGSQPLGPQVSTRPDPSENLTIRAAPPSTLTGPDTTLNVGSTGNSSIGSMTRIAVHGQ